MADAIPVFIKPSEDLVSEATESKQLSGMEQPRLNPLFMFRWEESQNSHVLLYPEGVVKLSGSAGEIIGRCDGARSIDQIVSDLKIAFKTDDDVLESDVRKFMELAYAKGWIVV